MKHIKKVTSKDRYGNQVSYEFESDQKPLDPTRLMEKQMDQMSQVPPLFEIPEGVPGVGGVSVGFAPAHPGEPKGTDTVPAWLTPGEFVMNKEGKEEMDRTIPGLLEMFNNLGREKQDAQGFQEGGPVPVPMSPTEALLRAREGFRSDVYLDTEKKPTVGHGHLLPAEYAGRVGERPFSDTQLDQWFSEDQDTALAAVKRNAKKYGVDWDKLNRREQAALTSMAFQLGETGQGEFENMWTALAAGDKETAALEALDSNWGVQTPERAKDVYNALTPGLGFADGGPVYAYRGYDVAQQDVQEIEDPTADLSSSWVPPVFGMDDVSPMEQAILDKEAMDDSQYKQALAQQIAGAENMVAGGDGDDLGTVDAPPQPEAEVPWWEGITDWAFGEEGTQVARDRNAAFDVKAADANVKAAEAELEAMRETASISDSIPGVGPSDAAIAAKEKEVEHLTNQAVAAEEAAVARGVIDYDTEKMYEHEAGIKEFHERAANNQEGPADDATLLEDLAESEEFEGEDDPSKNSEKGTQTPDEVKGAGEEAAKADPSALDKAKGFFKGAFSDLFDGKELGRMALMYLGSRALGYSHGGSLNWAAKQYVQRVDAKSAAYDKLVLSGKYTTESIKAYQESGDVADLQAVGVAPKALGNFKTFFSPQGKQVRAEEYDLDGTKVWMTPDGKRVNANWSEDASSVPGTQDYSKRIRDDSKQYEGMLNDLRTQFGTFGEGNDKQFATELAPAVAGNKIARWAAENRVSPEYMGSIVEGAYHAALADSQESGRKVRDITPYLNAQYVAAMTGDSSLFQDKEGKVVSGRKVDAAISSIQNLVPGASTTAIMQAARGRWNKLGPDGQARYNKQAKAGESGFLIFLQAETTKAASK